MLFDLDQLVHRHIRQVSELVISERMVAFVTDIQINHKAETSAAVRFPIVNPLADVRTGFNKSDAAMHLADHDAH